MICLLLVALGPAAKSPSAATVKKAKAHLKQGNAFYDAHEYDAALGEYEESYRLVALPDLFYNMAQCRRFKGDREEAIELYRKYVAAKPDGAAADDARALIAQLVHEAKQAMQASTSPVATSAPRIAGELGRLEFLRGSWQCKGGDVTASIRVGLTGGGSRLAFEYHDGKIDAAEEWSWDEGVREFLAAGSDGRGRTVDSSTTGWAGDRLVWEGTARGGGKRTAWRQTFLRTGADSFEHDLELQTAGEWKSIGHEVCKR